MKMRQSLFIALVLFLFSITPVSGQQKLLLQHQKSRGRKRVLTLDREYTFKLKDTVIISKVDKFTDSTLTIYVRRRAQDLTYTRTRTRRVLEGGRWVKKEKVVTLTALRYRIDTVTLAFEDIRVIQKNGRNNYWGHQAAAWVVLGGALGVVMLPVLAIQDGSDGVVDWLQFEGGVVALAGGFLLVDVIGNSLKTRYNLVKRWTLKRETDGLRQP